MKRGLKENIPAKIKILFLIHDLGQGGAEKVLVNLVNNMDSQVFDITVQTLFGGGINEQFLKERIRYKTCFPKNMAGNSHIMKLFSPEYLHRKLIRERYDIEVSYLEGPSARIISGCPYPETRLISWIHVEQHTMKVAAKAFRSYQESVSCYKRFHKTICVSNYVKKDFRAIYPMLNNIEILYNTVESEEILKMSEKALTESEDRFNSNEFKICGVGKILPSKGFDKLARIHKKLKDRGYPVHTYILGEGPDRSKIEAYLKKNRIRDSFTFLGYQTNPYKYMARCNLFVCTSSAEGFSTAATEALILGLPVITTPVSGMTEMLGNNNEYGIVTEDFRIRSIYIAIKDVIKDKDRFLNYKKRAIVRGKQFKKEETVKNVEEMLKNMVF